MKESCICPDVVKPVCGTDCQTYSNSCQLSCYNQRRRKRGLPDIEIAYQDECGIYSVQWAVSTEGQTHTFVRYLYKSEKPICA